MIPTLFYLMRYPSTIHVRDAELFKIAFFKWTTAAKQLDLVLVQHVYANIIESLKTI